MPALQPAQLLRPEADSARALLFDAIGPGNSLIQVSGVASTPEGTALALQFAPASVTVR